jgi:hypothetical protein
MTPSLVRVLIFTFLLVNTASAQNRDGKQRPLAQRATSTRSSNEHWYRFFSPDKDFVIQLPSKPERRADDEVPSGTSRNYILIKASMIFQLSYVDTGFEPTDQEANQFPPGFSREMIDHATQERGATMLRSQLLHINIYELEIIFPRRGDRNIMLHSVERYVIRYGRQYTLTCSSTTPNERVDLRVCQRFFDSFRIVGIPQPQ